MSPCNIVVVRSTLASKIAEALRAAVGLSLRGQAVCVFLDAHTATGSEEAQRALSTLKALGFPARPISELSHEWLQDALSVEIWA